MARPKGAKNKHSFQVEEIAHQYKMEPFEFAMAVMNNDWKRLGFKEESKVSYTNAGIEFEEANLKLTDRIKCMEFAGKYLYSQKQSIALSTGDTGIKLILEDYGVSSKKDSS